VSLRKVNLKDLLSPVSNLTMKAQIALNGRTVGVSCLSDTGADGYPFVNINLVG
jgi:hypothetical protein